MSLTIHGPLANEDFVWDQFQQHAPTVGLAGAIAAAVSIGRHRIELRSFSVRQDCLPLLLSYGRAVLLGSGGGSLSAAALVETIPNHPWLVVSLGALAGLSIDLATAAGPPRLLRLLLRLGSRVMQELSDDKKRP